MVFLMFSHLDASQPEKHNRPPPVKPLAPDSTRRMHSLLESFAADGLQRRICVGALLIAGLLFTLVWRVAHETTEIVERTSQDELDVYGQAIRINALEAMNLADFTLRQARKQWKQEGTIKTHEEYFEDFPNFKELITQVAIIDKHGMLVSSSLTPQPNPIWLGDREHFKIHENSQSDSLFISEPVLGRVSKRTTLQLTRPILNERREFNGVAVISLDPDYIASILFNRTDAQDINVRLTGDDGRVRVTAYPNRLPKSGQQADSTLLPIRSAMAYSNHAAPETHRWSSLAIEGYPLRLEVGAPNQRLKSELDQIRYAAWLVLFLLLVALLAYTINIIKVVRERNLLLIRLEESQVKASSANIMKSKFVSSISHELRTPLNGILGFSELIGMSQNLEEAQKFGKTVNKSAEHLHQLVNTLLDLAKIEAGQMEIVRTHNGLRELCESVTNIHRFNIEKKGLLFNLNLDKSTPNNIYTDRIKLMQILNNLLNNAVKFTDEGAIFISIALQHGRWQFTVADTGIGMTPQQLTDVFSRFNNIKMHQKDSSVRPGSGLGMALCKELVELLGGQIDIQSQHQVGTVVTFHIPHLHGETNN